MGARARARARNLILGERPGVGGGVCESEKGVREH